MHTILLVHPLKIYSRLHLSPAEVSPLTSLFSKSKHWKQQQERQLGFDNVKQALSTAPVVLIPDFEKLFQAEINAFNMVIRAGLLKGQGPARQPIHYFSKKLFPTEQQYAPYDHKLLAIVADLKNFKPCVQGKKIALYTNISHSCNSSPSLILVIGKPDGCNSLMNESFSFSTNLASKTLSLMHYLGTQTIKKSSKLSFQKFFYHRILIRLLQ